MWWFREGLNRRGTERGGMGPKDRSALREGRGFREAQ